MKKLLLILAVHSFLQFKSQTLTAGFHEPKPGDVQTSIVMDTSTFTSGLPLTITGANLNWDFTKLKADSFVFSTNYVLPSSSSYSVDFPTATMVQKEGGNLEVFIRSKTTPTTQTEVLGIRSPGFFSTTFTDVAVAAIFPITLGSTHSDNIAGTFTYSTYNGTVKGKITSVADGSGTLTLPDGFVYKQVLRVKTVQTLTASVFLPIATINQTSYDFYDMSEKFPIVNVSYSEISLGGSVTVTAGANGNNKSFLAGIRENNLAKNFSFYPSPAEDQIVLSCNSCTEKNSSYEIADGLGRIVISPKPLGASATTVDVSMLKPGVYSLTFSLDGKRMARKLVIQK